MSERVVIVGSSVGGIRTAQELRGFGFQGEIVVLGEESEMPYDKPPLSKQLLVGSMDESDVALLGDAGWAGLEIDGRLGQRATGLDIDEMVVRVEGGDDVDYDALVIATGVRARRLPGPVDSHKAVFTVRELRDSRDIAARLSGRGPVAVVGAGFIGAEIASSARSLGLDVTMLEALAEPFARVLGGEVGAHLADLHRAHGVETLTHASVESIERTGDGAAVRLADGRVVEAATVVVGIGTVTNTEWLYGSGVPVDNGVLVDEGCAVQAAEGVYAVGDVASRLDPASGTYRRVEHWTNAVEQARVVAQQIVEPWAPTGAAKAPYFWSDQFGTKIQMVGRIAETDQVHLERYLVSGTERTVALYSRAGVLSAAVTFGWPRAVAACRTAWDQQLPLETVRDQLAALSARKAPAA
jgi:NADPH-dependent 2,4-dienoyl-CoA reductase/sulfur reductase-like enzyme